MNWLRKLYPFNAEQTVNIVSEFGPLVAMFIMNAAYGINVGTWALIITTGMAIVAMLLVLGRLPMFPLIASTVTIVFGLEVFYLELTTRNKNSLGLEIFYLELPTLNKTALGFEIFYLELATLNKSTVLYSAVLLLND